MPQIAVDFSDASVAQLRDVAEMLIREADRREVEMAGLIQIPAPPAPLVTRIDVPRTPTEPTGDMLDPAKVFAQPTAIIPPPPPPAVLGERIDNAAHEMRRNVIPTPVERLPDAVLSASALDKAGFPHDPRIHSATPTIKADGFWRQRRNLDNPTLVAVEAELRAQGYGVPPVNAPVIPPPPPPVIIPPPPPPVVAAPMGTSTVMVPPPPQSAPVVPSGADAFRTLMKRIDGHTGEGGRLALDIMKPIHAEFGATGWQDYFAKCAAQVPALNARLDGMLS